MLPPNTVLRVSKRHIISNEFNNNIFCIDIGSDAWSLCCDEINKNVANWKGEVYITVFASSETIYELEVLSKYLLIRYFTERSQIERNFGGSRYKTSF